MRDISQENNIRDLNSEKEWRLAAVVLQTLRPTLAVEHFLARKKILTDEGYRLIGFFKGNKVVAICSYTISPHIMLGRELLIHDVATLREYQGLGLGSALVMRLRDIAKKNNCGRIFVHTIKAQEFYSKNGFQLYSSGMIEIL